LKLTINVGEERTIVAGIGASYGPEEMVGRKIAVVLNLKPVKLMGVESHGMLLATETQGKISLVSFDGDAPAGGRIS
jgi:methionyl-tRNA synthetase